MISSTMALESIKLSARVSLFKTIKNVSALKKSFYPCNMEELGQPTGYLLYRTHLARHSKEERLRVIDARDRIQLFLDEKHVKTQYQEEIGQDILIHQEGETTQLDILVENMGRVSYGHKLTAPSQQKD